jgi:phosphoenolpyruvate-protein kinase (PTS system EI component)
MSAVSIPEVKATVRQMTQAETKVLVDRVRNLPTAAEVRAMVTDYVFGLATPRKEPV